MHLVLYRPKICHTYILSKCIYNRSLKDNNNNNFFFDAFGIPIAHQVNDCIQQTQQFCDHFTVRRD